MQSGGWRDEAGAAAGAMTARPVSGDCPYTAAAALLDSDHTVSTAIVILYL